MLSPWYKVAMWILVPIPLLFWSPNPVLWNKLSLISGSSEYIPGLFVDVIGHFIQVPTNSLFYGWFSWLSTYLKELLPPLDSAVPAFLLPILLQTPESDTEVLLTWDHSLWLFTGALVMALDAYFPPLSHLVSFGRPLRAAIPFLHWMASWWLVPPGWEPNFFSLAPLSYSIFVFEAKSTLTCKTAHMWTITPIKLLICGHDLVPNNFPLVTVRIDNSFPLGTWAQEWDLNPDPESPQAACPRFPEVKPPQAEAKNDGPNSKADQTKGISATNGRVIKAPNGGNVILTISFMSLKSALTSNQESFPERGTGPRPYPMTTTLEQDNQVADLRSLTNERTPGPGAILPPLNQSTQNPQARLLQCPDEPPMKIQDLPALLPADFCPSGALFGPFYFTEYPLKPEYKDYTPEKILKLDPLARIQSAVRCNRQGPWIFSTPKLFRGKFNCLSVYDLHMELPVTHKPMPASSPDLPTDHTDKLFGIVYITLMGVSDTIIPAACPWSWVKKVQLLPF
ncbi:hypothetical protein DSO57_1031383 [Entomophthora muscae]|uniref:Uncharacterized protein n=1 Tax=Entomophthora muscae TaxID=34485 RepID=A0ACC2TCP5_9FUNG|nr:hypothetical protein DSO57_1031383 [Entomophthora muscae]